MEFNREFDAAYLGCDATDSVHVNASTNEYSGELEMHIATPIGDVVITKAQAMLFFGLIDA